MNVSWKDNWTQTQQHFVDWWNHEGLVLGQWGAPPAAQPHERVARPALLSRRAGYADSSWRAASTHHALAHQAFVADTLPLTESDFGPGSLAIILGAEPDPADDTVWYKSCWEQVEAPESLPALRFDPRNHW